MTDTAAPVAGQGRVRIERGAKRIRAYLGGHVVADTIEPLLVWEKPYYPAYYVPASDVRAELVPTGATDADAARGEAQVLDVRVGGVEAPGAALRYDTSPVEELRDAVRLDWPAMDAWFEEDEQVFTHPRNPYTRVDILPSSRTVRVEVGGVVIAETSQAMLLFETGLPTRYYLPKTHVRMDLLRPTATESHCPYKGQASYWSVDVDGDVREDAAWSYPTPLPESERVAGLVCFYPERVDVFVDGRPAL
jgi:uncharacterized protein (DUF427 family)